MVMSRSDSYQSYPNKKKIIALRTYNFGLVAMYLFNTADPATIGRLVCNDNWEQVITVHTANSRLTKCTVA